MKTLQSRTNIHPHNKPTNREIDVLRLLANGLDHQQIAQKLSISTETSKSRLKTVRAKLDAATAAAAIYKAVKSQLLE